MTQNVTRPIGRGRGRLLNNGDSRLTSAFILSGTNYDIPVVGCITQLKFISIKFFDEGAQLALQILMASGFLLRPRPF